MNSGNRTVRTGRVKQEVNKRVHYDAAVGKNLLSAKIYTNSMK